MSAAPMLLLGILSLTLAQPAQPVNQNAQTQQQFRERVAKYTELRKGVEAKLPHLPEKAEPETIAHHKEALLAALQRARSDARPGDIFQQDIRHLIRRMIAGALAAEGPAPRQAIREENPGERPVRINSAFPRSVPLSTVPPQVLQALPRLPDEEIEYRFVGTRLLLLDTRASMVIDYMDRALTK